MDFEAFNLKTIQKIAVVSLLVALASQVNLELLESDFVVSAGVIIFVIFLYHYEDINPILLGISSGAMVFILRLVVYQVTVGAFTEAITPYMLEMIFYVIYAIFYTLLLENDRKDNLGFVFIVFIMCDFASNFIEGFVRYAVLTKPTIIEVIPTLLIVSIIRSSVVWIVLTSFNYYDMMLTKREHEYRYKRLLWLTSQLKSEMFWIEKNMDNIQKTMTQSYELFEQINNNQDNESWANKALNIAKDVHEIKRENELVVRGIKDITEKELNDSGMEYNDINSILLETMKIESVRLDKKVELEFKMGENFYTSKHYYLMSVLRNLIMNSMDSFRKSQKDAKISVVHQINEIKHIFKISDNGTGIEAEYLKDIFSPGYSTKVNNETGEVNRGLGLSIVQYIVEEQLKGTVEINSTQGSGTTFIISIPKTSLE